MFERFHKDARQAVILAQQEARRLLQHHVGAEHLLLGLLDAGEGPAAGAMRGRGLTADGLRDRLSTLTGPTIDPLDPEALASIGIDLTEIRRAAEDAFGEGALDAPAGAAGAGKGARKGHIPFTPEAKKALELALRHALRLKHKSIDGGHVLLGVLHTKSALVTLLLRDAGVDPEALRADVTRLLSADDAA